MHFFKTEVYRGHRNYFGCVRKDKAGADLVAAELERALEVGLHEEQQLRYPYAQCLKLTYMILFWGRIFKTKKVDQCRRSESFCRSANQKKMKRMF